MNQHLPEWGILGNGSEAITRYIACCALLPMEDAGNNETANAMEDKYKTEMAYMNAGELYMPLGFSREKGWVGQTYGDAFTSCGQQGGQNLCPYEAICPVGPGCEPLFGYREEGEGGSWVPIFDDVNGNDWVQVLKELPDWGQTGIGNKEINRHVFCCIDPVETETQ